MITKRIALRVGKKLGVIFNKVSLSEFTKGMRVELERRNVTRGSLLLTGKIALAHLEELPDYYTRLSKMERRR